MYNNPYYGPYNPQLNIDRINNQIAELEKMKSQIPPTQPTSINQTFQLASNNQNTMRYADSIDDVEKELVIGDTPFFSKDMSVLWIKNSKGEIKSYELNEIIRKDEKDVMIENLQYQIKELRKEIKGHAKPIYEYDDEPVESEKSADVPVPRTSSKKSK